MYVNLVLLNKIIVKYFSCMKNIGLASDHAGFDFKLVVRDYLYNLGYNIVDFGCESDVSCDYADYAHLLGSEIDNFQIQVGLVFCGSGNGISMTINKHSGVRSALCWNTEIASLARHHNDANVCSVPSRFIDIEEVIKIIDIFLTEPFDGGRHLLRIKKIPI